LAEISGQTLKDMMEMTMQTWPEENGAFPHVSGMRFSVNTAIPSGVELTAEEEFAGVSGPYRVYGIEIFNRETEQYEPIDLNKTYTIAAVNYYLLEYGNGLTMLANSEILQNDGISDVEALARYIDEVLGGVVGREYAEVTAHITFTEGEPEKPAETESMPAETESMPAETESTPAETESTPAETESTPAETESTPVGTDDDVDSDKDFDSALVICVVLGAAVVLVVAYFVIRKKYLSQDNA
jgi:hypothetical protein